MVKTTSQKDLVADMNAAIPEKIIVLEAIKTIEPFKSNGRVSGGGKGGEMGDGSSRFVTGSRIKRYTVGGVKKQHSLHR